MSLLDRSSEYLVWYEHHRDRWIAAPIERFGDIIIECDYTDRVVLDLPG